MNTIVTPSRVQSGFTTVRFSQEDVIAALLAYAFNPRGPEDIAQVRRSSLDLQRSDRGTTNFVAVLVVPDARPPEDDA